MSANREDALNELRGPRLRFSAQFTEEPDEPTEDLADEITSELVAEPGLVLAAQTDAPAQPESSTIDDVLRDRYVLEEQLGAGGTAVVYRAIDLRRDAMATDGHKVAVKVLKPELRDRPHAVARLQREFRQSLAAAHPGVVRVFDIDCDRGAWFIVMELLSGSTLGMTLRGSHHRNLPAAEALRIACSAGDALAHAHAVGVVHGDVKPDNIFLTDSGDVRLLDFGVAPESSSDAGESVPAAATRVWASPEVLASAVPVPRDDVFSLACVAYEMLAGTRPYGRRGANGVDLPGFEPARIASLDDARWSALESALSPERAARPDMADFVRALRGGERRSEWPAAASEAAVPEEPVATVAQPTIVATQPAPRSRKLSLFAGLAALLALLAGILIGRMREPEVNIVPPAPVSTPAAVVNQELLATPAAAPQRQEPPLPKAEAPHPAPVTRPPGIVYFESPQMTVSKRAVVAAIPMRAHSDVRRIVNVKWRIIEGTARAGRDFGGPLAGNESFVEGNSFRILYVPILQNPAATRDRRFTVEMTSASAGTDLGPTPRVEVTILGAS